MNSPTATSERAALETEIEVLVIGAGFSGLALLRHVLKLDLPVRVIEAGSDVGGTWYWNRYPGARTDTESWYYCLSHDKDLLQQWDWKERYPGQAEVLEYLRHVADRYDYRKYITFNTRMDNARFDGERNRWIVTLSTGEVVSAHYLVSAMGILSKPYLPDFKGISSFRGDILQTQKWPHEEPDFTGKRVLLIGTGASGVQAVPQIAQRAAHLTVFQRTANYVLPQHNHDLDAEHLDEFRKDYDNVWKRVFSHPFAMPFEAAGRKMFDVDAEAQQEILEYGWQRGGFRYLFETFDDIILDEKANAVAAEFIRKKIRETVKDPVTAELLCPKDHPYASKRPPGGHYYFETYNRENVKLVDVKTNVIEEITPTGIRLADGTHYEGDVIVFATGFDGFTGALTDVDIRNHEGRSIREHWSNGVRTFMGLAVSGFPNFLLVCGPLTTFSNIPPVIEKTAEWVGNMLGYLKANGLDKVEVNAAGEEYWVREVADRAAETLVPLATSANNWLAGANIPGKPVGIMLYMGGFHVYCAKAEAEADAQYPHFTFNDQPAGERGQLEGARIQHPVLASAS